MTRIVNLAASNQLLAFLGRTHQRVHDLQLQVASEKVSQDYAGIAHGARRLVNLETSRDLMERFVQGNELMATRLNLTSTTVEAIRKTVRDFRANLLAYGNGEPLTESAVEDLQSAAFRALVDMETYLNTDADGQFLFAGARATTRPVEFGLSDLAAFQASFDGDAVVYPPTRASHVETDLSLSAADTGGLTMLAGNTISAAIPGSLAGIPIGATITLSGTALNDGRYTVVTNNGNDIQISGAMTVGSSTINVVNSVVNEGPPPVAATLTVDSWYHGDSLSQTHRVDRERSFSLSLNAIDPAFEKAIRAMGLIAQGAYGTAGGLDQNIGRIDQAIELLNNALDRAAGGTPPFGTELTGSIEAVQMDLGFKEVVLDQSNRRHEDFIGFLEAGVADIENADTTEAITRLLDDSRALEASYQTTARIQELSLVNFL